MGRQGIHGQVAVESRQRLFHVFPHPALAGHDAIQIPIERQQRFVATDMPLGIDCRQRALCLVFLQQLRVVSRLCQIKKGCGTFRPRLSAPFLSRALVRYPLQMPHGTVGMVEESLVLRTPLANPHHSHFGREQFYFIMGGFQDASIQLFALPEIHLQETHIHLMVQCLTQSADIPFRSLFRLQRACLCTIRSHEHPLRGHIIQRIHKRDLPVAGQHLPDTAPHAPSPGDNQDRGQGKDKNEPPSAQIKKVPRFHRLPRRCVLPADAGEVQACA